jgi:hypothetical protein
MAQQADAAARQSASANAAGARVNETTKAGADAQAGRSGAQMSGAASGSVTAADEMRPVKGELVGKLDSKSAKEGDRVEVKTRESVKTADGTVIPKGSRLVGHVTSVQAHGSGSANSQMAIAFDRAELKGGQSLAIQSEIRSVAPPMSAVAAGSMESEDDFGGSAMGGGGRTARGARVGGGGLLGGATSASAGELASTTQRASSGLDATAGETVRATGHVAGGAGERAGLAARATSSVGAHATGIPGVMLAGSGSGSASGTLSATKKNVHLDAGTQMELGVAAIR